MQLADRMDQSLDDAWRLDMHGTWQQYVAHLSLRQMHSQPADVFHRHLQDFPQHVVQRGLETTSLAANADLHALIASFIPAPQPPSAVFYAAVANDAYLLQEKITKTYMVSKIAEKIDALCRPAIETEACTIDLNGLRDPMLSWIREVHTDCWPLGLWQSGVLHASSFCKDSFPQACNLQGLLLELLQMLGYQATVSKKGNTLYLAQNPPPGT